MTLLLGAIADDLTGATDLGLMLSRHGMPVTLFPRQPAADAKVDTPAAIIALKTRTVEPAVAVARSGTAADWLLERGAERFFFKYCSTFDSTARGNIGPVCDFLLERLDETMTLLLPAFPENGRIVRNGRIYVDGRLLSESPMRDHPLTPMTESSLVELMDRQTRAGATSSVSLDEVRAGERSLSSTLTELGRKGYRYVAPDCENDADLQAIARASKSLRLLTGGSGIAAAIPALLREAGELPADAPDLELPALPGHAAVLAGSCSAATRAQVRRYRDSATAIRVDPLELAGDGARLGVLERDAVDAAQVGDIVVYSTAEPERLAEIQSALGAERSANLVENALAAIAARLAESGVAKFVIAGGETSGAVASRLGLTKLAIGPAIDPGVPWMMAHEPRQGLFAFKSGNFGAEDFFARAIGMLP